MRARLVFSAAIVLASVLAACGGGGGGGGVTPPPHTATPSPTPTPTLSPNSNGCVESSAVAGGKARSAAVGIQPPNSGASFTYTGTISNTIDRSSPCPIGTSTATGTVGITAEMTSATNEEDVETDNYSTNSTQVTTNATVATVTTGSSQTFTESQETSTDLVGDSTATTYGLQALTYAVSSPLPYSGTIANDPPSTINVALADGSSDDRTYNAAANGSYSENDQLPGGAGTNTISVNSNGSAQYVVQTGQFAGSPNFVDSVTLAYSAPASSTITLNVTYAESGPGPAQPSPFPIQQWWPSNATSLYSDTTQDEGEGALPSPCNPSPSASSGDDFRRTIVNIDPALGSYDTRTIDSYVVQNYGASGFTVGPVCVVISDQEKLFYDYFFDTPYFFYISQDGNPFQTNTISEAYWLHALPTGLIIRRADATGIGSVSGLAASIASHTAGLDFVRATERARRIEAFATAVRAGHLKGVIVK